jgi:hypothetical protein
MIGLRIVKTFVYHNNIDYVWTVMDGYKELFRSMFIPECKEFIDRYERD